MLMVVMGGEKGGVVGEKCTQELHDACCRGREIIKFKKGVPEDLGELNHLQYSSYKSDYMPMQLEKQAL